MLKSRPLVCSRCIPRDIARWAGFMVLLIGLLLPGTRLFAAQVDPSVPPDVLRDFETLRRQLDQNPRDVGVLNSLGIVYARAGQVNDALSVWKRALEIDPRYIHLYNNIGSALKTQKRFAEAREVFLRGLHVAPSYWIYYNLGLLEKELGHSPEAIRSFQECLKMNRAFEPAQRKLFELSQQSGVRLSGGSAPGLMPPPVLPFPFEVKPPVAPQSEEDGNDEGIEDEEQTPERPPRVIPPVITAPISTVADCVAILSRHPTGSEPRLVALTFDDGPHSDLTPRLLDYLRSQGARATFFVIGSRAETYPDLVSRMVDEGHEVGNHTWSHRSLVNAGPSAALADLKRTADLLNGLTGRPCRLVRPPYGHTSNRVEKLIRSQGWHQVMWDADSRDWAGGSTQAMLQRVMRQFSNGAIVLFHDIHPGMLKVLTVLVPALKKCGYRFVTVSELWGLMRPTS